MQGGKEHRSMERVWRESDAKYHPPIDLDALTWIFLLHRLDGKETTLLLQWHDELIDEQVQYAALDALASWPSTTR